MKLAISHITLRLFATRGFPATRAQNRFAGKSSVFRPRSGPSALLTTAPRLKLHGSTLLTANAVARDLDNGRTRPGCVPGGSGVVQPPRVAGRFQLNAPLSVRRCAVSSPSKPVFDTRTLYHQTPELSRAESSFFWEKD